MAASSLMPRLLDAPAIEKFANQLELMSQTSLLICSNVCAKFVELPNRRLIHRLLELGAERHDFLLHPEKLVIFIVAADFDVEGLRQQAQKEHGEPAAEAPPELRAGAATKLLFEFIESSK
jgi:hypothetical protein